MAGDFSFGPFTIYDPDTNQLVQNATGGLFLDMNGTVQPFYDDNRQPITSLTTNVAGQPLLFRADIAFGRVRFGDLIVNVQSNEVFQYAVDARNAVSEAQDAKEAAQLALARIEEALAGGGFPGGGGGGLPVGTTLDQIGDGQNRVAMSSGERQKLNGVASGATKVEIGTAAGQAKPGTWLPTLTELKAVQNYGGTPGVLSRTAAQGLPTDAEMVLAGAQPGAVVFVEKAT